MSPESSRRKPTPCWTCDKGNGEPVARCPRLSTDCLQSVYSPPAPTREPNWHKVKRHKALISAPKGYGKPHRHTRGHWFESSIAQSSNHKGLRQIQTTKSRPALDIQTSPKPGQNSRKR